MRVSNDDVAAVQRDYPKIYLACHTRHVRRRTGRELTPQESTLLAHLSVDEPTRPSELARHLGIGAPSLSAATKRLIALGYIARSRDEDDRRAACLRLSRAGAAAMQEHSVLERARVARMLRLLTVEQRRLALTGLSLLADAARRLSQEGA